MKRKAVQDSYVEEQKKDAEEIINLLKCIPNEEKGMVKGILIGFALGIEKPCASLSLNEFSAKSDDVGKALRTG